MNIITRKDPRSPISEAFKNIRTNIQFSSIDMDIKKILVTSTGPGEGKTSVICNLAVTIALTGKSVLLLDMDLRKPKINRRFMLNNDSGATNVLAGRMELNEAVVRSSTPNLFILTSGPKPPNPAEIIGSKRMKDFLDEAGEMFDYILIDSPPVLAVTDASILSTKIDGTILVIESGKTEIDHAMESKKQLEKVGANIIGAILNKVKVIGKSKYGYYSSYYEETNTENKRRR
ncbi:MAG TPA: CpsD/CapB family tyrosine-protein kinase [Clostridia bacterium]|nr:CpsD/CapB family tyrosine-protein kinase [Clostridia bacterium]